MTPGERPRTNLDTPPPQLESVLVTVELGGRHTGIHDT